MVSPHSDWEDEEDGYVMNDTAVFVRTALVDDISVFIPENEDDANAYGVEIRTGYGSGHGTHDWAAFFEDPLTAWKYANLLTHFFAIRGGGFAAKNDLLHQDPYDEFDPEPVPRPVEELSAEGVFKRQLPEYQRPAAIIEMLNE